MKGIIYADSVPYVHGYVCKINALTSGLVIAICADSTPASSSNMNFFSPISTTGVWNPMSSSSVILTTIRFCLWKTTTKFTVSGLESRAKYNFQTSSRFHYCFT